ncbi:MAG: tyrosine-protein phosphatase [Elusimicrobiota bacterium]|jgi:protein tyrosine/serine phosphatase|nr:tyrosine-protein phosphatase [Elusimicrobiota bacterium]
MKLNKILDRIDEENNFNDESNNDFANFREICMGSIAHGKLYRSSHPAPNGVEDIVISSKSKRAGIKTIINFTDDKDGLKYSKDSPWYWELVKSKSVIALHTDFDFMGRYFCGKFRKAIEFMLSHKPPYLIHCYAGVDRTGFASMIIESLMDANMQEIIDDYLLSYDFGIGSAINTKDEKVVKEQLKEINKGKEATEENLKSIADRYFSEKVGLTRGQIEALKKILASKI